MKGEITKTTPWRVLKAGSREGRCGERGALVMMKGYVLSENELSACVQREMVIFHQNYARPTRTKQAGGFKWELAEEEQLRSGHGIA